MLGEESTKKKKNKESKLKREIRWQQSFLDL